MAILLNADRKNHEKTYPKGGEKETEWGESSEICIYPFLPSKTQHTLSWSIATSYISLETIDFVLKRNNEFPLFKCISMFVIGFSK